MGLPQPPQADEPSRAVPNPEHVAVPEGPIKFAPSGEFHQEVRRRVDRYFRSTGRWQRDCLQMYLKTAIIFAWFAASYVLLVFFAADLVAGRAAGGVAGAVHGGHRLQRPARRRAPGLLQPPRGSTS